MKDPTRLQVLVCTVASRLPHIDASGWPQLPGVSYLVSCQNPDGLTADLSAFDGRDDIEVALHADRGLSINRNHALDGATAPYVLIADDDTSFHAEGLQEIISIFDAEPTLDYLTVRSEQPESRVYPADGYTFDSPCRGYSPTSIEIALRLESTRRTGLRFNELLGIGAPYLACGEENLLLIDARRRHLAGRFRDIVVATHPDATTSVRQKTAPGVLRAKGAIMRLSRGAAGALIRLPIEANRSGLPFFEALRYLWQGSVYAKTHKL